MGTCETGVTASRRGAPMKGSSMFTFSERPTAAGAGATAAAWAGHSPLSSASYLPPAGGSTRAEFASNRHRCHDVNVTGDLP